MNESYLHDFLNKLMIKYTIREKDHSFGGSTIIVEISKQDIDKKEVIEEFLYNNVPAIWGREVLIK